MGRGRLGRSVRASALAVAAIVAVGAAAAFAKSSSQHGGPSPAQLTAGSPITRHFEYVLNSGTIYIYSIDQHNKLVQTVGVPQIAGDPHGVVASPATGRLYVSFGGEGGSSGNGSMLAFDLRRETFVWQQNYPTGIDSMAITPNGRTIYMPAGAAP